MPNSSSGTRWRDAAVVTLLLSAASMLPSPFARRQQWERVGPDKVLHLVGHAGYALTLVRAFSAGRHTRREATVLAVSVSTAHSLVTGQLQRRIPGRAFEPADAVAGLIGAVFAVLGWHSVTDKSENGCT